MNVFAILALTSLCMADPPSAPGELRFEDLPLTAPSQEFLAAILKKIGGDPASEEELEALHGHFANTSSPSFSTLARLAVDRDYQKEWDERFRRELGRPIRAAELLEMTRYAFHPADEHYLRIVVRDFARPKNFVVAGVLKNTEGTPLVGAEVAALEGVDRTDSEGRFTIHIVKPKRGNIALSARSAAGDVARASVSCETADHVEGVELVAENTKRLFGVVLDVAGKPVPNAVVSSYQQFQGALELAMASTDSEGRFEIGGFLPGVADKVNLTAWATGYVSSVIVAALGEKQSIELKPAARISGRVVGPDGQPLARCPIRIKGRAHQTITGADGRFTAFSKVGEVVVEAVPRDFLPGEAQTTTSLERETTDVEIACAEGGFAAGTIKSVAGKPVPHVQAMVQTVRGGKPHSRYFASDADGAFRVGPLFPDQRYDASAFNVSSDKIVKLRAGDTDVTIAAPEEGK